MNLPEFMAVPGVQVIAVCDVDSWRLGQAKALVESTYAKQAPSGGYKGCDTHRDFREVLARRDVDAVMISTPDHWHVPMALMALRAGKDVSLEKPITRYISEGRLLVNEVAKHSASSAWTASSARSSASIAPPSWCATAPSAP